MTIKEEGPTPSTTSNQIINLCQAVIDGEVPLETLTRALTKCSDALIEARGDFVRQVEESGDEHMAALEEEIEDVLAAFLAYQSSLKTLGQCTNNRKKQHLTNGINELITATNALLNALTTYEDRELITSGPSDNQYVNLLIRMGQRLATGELEEEIYLETITNAEKVMEESLSNLSKEQDPLLNDEMAEFKHAVALHQDAIKLFKEFASTKNMQTLDDASPLLIEASNRIKDEFMKVATKRLTTGPSKSPHVNLVMNALKGFSEGAVVFEAYVQAVNYFKTIMEETHREFNKLAAIRTNSVQVEEETQRIAIAIQVQDEFVTELEKVQTIDDANTLLLNSSKFTNAADTFTESFQNILSMTERENKVLCIRCQHYNYPESRSCENCHAILPKLSGAYSTSTFVVNETGDPSQRRRGEMPVTKELHELLTAVNKVAEREITCEEFLEVVNWMEGYINTTENNVRSYVTSNIEKLSKSALPPQEKQQIKEALENAQKIVMEGSAIAREGLNSMRNFTEDPNQEYLTEGVRLVWQGFQQKYELYQTIEAIKQSSEA